MSILAKNLKTVRKELGCTQSVMSEILKVGFRTFVRYEGGTRDAPVSVLITIALLANISLEQLLTSEVDKNDGKINDWHTRHEDQHLEVYCDNHPDSLECRVYDD